MSSPGSSHALVLPSNSVVSDEVPPPGERMAVSLSNFLNLAEYRGLAVVHGLGQSAPTAFDLAKQRRPQFAGVVWVTDPNFLANLSGPNAAQLQQMLAPVDGYLVSFVSLVSKKVVAQVRWYHLRAAEMDKGFAQAMSG